MANGKPVLLQSKPDPKFIPKILDIQIEPLRSDSYDKLEQGILHLERKMTVAFSIPEASNLVHPQHRNLLSPVTKEEIGYIQYNISLYSNCAPAVKPRIIFLVCCLNSKKSDGVDMWTYAPALQPVLDALEGPPGTMRRVGLVSRIKPEFWKQIIKLMRFNVC